MLTLRGMTILILPVLFLTLSASCTPSPILSPDGWETIGRGTVTFHGGEVTLRNAFIHSRDTLPEAFAMTFTARSLGPGVQMWSGFGCRGRDERYALGLRGDNNNDLYLCRYSPGGTDEMLALAGLDHAVKPDEEHRFTIVCVGNAIRIYLDGDTQPRIALHDMHHRHGGSAVLGGGWIATTYKDVAVRALTAVERLRYLRDSTVVSHRLTPSAKERLRAEQRARYLPARIAIVASSRTEASLNGTWLFKPGYAIGTAERPADPADADGAWHVMQVPAFWTPVRNWLHLQESGLPHGGSGVSDNYREREEARCAGYSFDHARTHDAWYRHWIELPEGVRDKHVAVRFDAVAMAAEVFCNGERAGSNLGMFGPFEVDLTSHVRPGRNLLAIHVRAAEPDTGSGAQQQVARAVSVDITRAMLRSLPHGMFAGTEAGIWQPVTLLITQPVRMTDIFAQTRSDGGEIHVTCSNPSRAMVSRALALTITKDGASAPLYVSPRGLPISIPPGDTAVFTYRLPVLSPERWSPEMPNLYRLSVRLIGGEDPVTASVEDEQHLTIGFRTFEVRGDRFYLNGHPYWLRGANHPPCGIAPNDTALADRFLRLMHDGNEMVTRTHGCPFTQTWMDAADRQGVGVSYEGTWPWLMIRGTPDSALVSVWREEFLRLVKRYRNHPSLLLWTINNEMSFTMFHHEGPAEERLANWTVISDVIKEIRTLHPGAVICGDSGYNRVAEDHAQVLLPHGIDDGDTDDRHVYFNWYNNDFFQIFNGEFDKRIYWSPGANPGRPYFGQEVSTGYPNNDDGHFCRKYLFHHYVPQAFYGDMAWEDHDPLPSLQRHAFMTKELAEVIRRTSPLSAGLLLFANVCWFRDVDRADRITPYPVYDAVKLAYQPVLPSIELFGRNVYAGDRIRPRITVVNNAVDGSPCGTSVLLWQVMAGDSVLASGERPLPAIPHDSSFTDSILIALPAHLPAPRTACTLQCAIRQHDRTVAVNRYDLLVCERAWTALSPDLREKRIGLFDRNGRTRAVFDALGIPYVPLRDLTEIRWTHLDALVVANLDADDEVPYNWEDVKNMPAHGVPVLLQHAGKHLQWLLWSQVDETYEQVGRCANMKVPEHPAFIAIEPFDLAWWQGEGRERPAVCKRSYRFKRMDGITPLVTYLRPHVYLSAPEEELREMNGIPLAEIRNHGLMIASELALNSGTRDPIAGRVLVNLLSYMLREPSR